MPGQHGGQTAAATADDQHAAGLFLREQPEQGVNIGRQAYAEPVGKTVMVMSLPIGQTAAAIVLDNRDLGG